MNVIKFKYIIGIEQLVCSKQIQMHKWESTERK